MRLRDSSEEAAFRVYVRTWLGENLTEQWRQDYASLEGRARIDFLRKWQGQLYEVGLAVRSWPSSHGGKDAPLAEDMIVFEELANHDAPPDVFRIGVRIIAPMLMKLARADQRETYVPRIADGRDLWSQGFSEPACGSDLSALTTRAVRQNGKFVITGQKVWNTYGHLADYCLLLARTNPDAPPHKGLSAFVVPLTTKGIEIRPLRQMNGQQDFNEIFFDDVEIGEEALVGELDGGWKVAMTMLDFERRGISVLGFGCRRLYEHLIALARATRTRDGGRCLIELPDVRENLVRVGVQARIAVLNNHRFAAMHSDGSVPGPETSVQKLHTTELNKTMHALALDLVGRSDLTNPQARKRFSAWEREYLTSFGMTIAGGTSQIQRNIISERLLGLPR